MFSSESTSHFMSGSTYQILLHGLVAPAYDLKRKQLNVDRAATGLLLADAWSGFHCFRSGLDKARAAWSESMNVKLPSLQAGSCKRNT